MFRLLVSLLLISLVSLSGCQESAPVPPPDAPTIPKVRNKQDHVEKLKQSSSLVFPQRFVDVV
jgi:hypothetical protein